MKQSTKETIHTVIQVVVSLAAAVPLFVTTGNEFAGAGGILAGAALVTRVMALDSVQDFLSRFDLNVR